MNAIEVWRPQPGNVYAMDAFLLMGTMPDASADMFLSDVPYNITAAKWEHDIDLPAWWAEVKRILKPGGACVMTASQPFTSRLVMSNPAWFKYEWIWDKGNPTGHMNAEIMPLKRHEEICVFYQDAPKYTPQMTKYDKPRIVNGGSFRVEGGDGISSYGVRARGLPRLADERYPVSILYFPIGDRSKILHPNQKPIALFEYLIRTYTQPGDLVFDPYVGSGTTAVAARNVKRQFIVGDVSPDYVAIARERLRRPDEPHYVTKESAPMEDLPLFASARAAGE